jgi:hypothetical protein
VQKKNHDVGFEQKGHFPSENRQKSTKVVFTTGLPDFPWYNIPKREKIYQITTLYTKTGKNIPNYHKIYQKVHLIPIRMTVK